MAKLKRGSFCPLIKKDCKGLECLWYTQVRGNDPQTGQAVDEWGCAVAWMPMLTINTAQQVKQGSAATEGVRNQLATILAPVAQTQAVMATLVTGATTIKLESGNAAN